MNSKQKVYTIGTSQSCEEDIGTCFTVTWQNHNSTKYAKHQRTIQNRKLQLCQIAGR